MEEKKTKVSLKSLILILMLVAVIALIVIHITLNQLKSKPSDIGEGTVYEPLDWESEPEKDTGIEYEPNGSQFENQ